MRSVRGRFARGTTLPGNSALRTPHSALGDYSLTMTIPCMNSGCGINPTTRLFPSTTTIVDLICASVSSNCSILNRSEEHTSELQSHSDLVCRLLLEKKKKKINRK